MTLNPLFVTMRPGRLSKSKNDESAKRREEKARKKLIFPSRLLADSKSFMQIRRIRASDLTVLEQFSESALVHDLGWVAEVAGQLVGYNSVEQIITSKAVNFWLHGCVREAWHGQGIGWELLQRSWADITQAISRFTDKTGWVHGWARADEEARGRLLRRLGLQPYHIYHEFRLPVTAVIPVPISPPQVTIRTWTESDYTEAVALRNQAFAHNWGYQPTTEAALRRRFASRRYQAAYSFTAWHNGNMVGLVHGHWQPKQATGEVVWLAVEANYRHHGLGKALMLTVMQALRQAGAQTITLSTDNYADQPKIGLYLQLGFEIQTAIIDYQKQLRSKE